MKTILLLGDSIRMSYEDRVKTAFQDQAVVVGPEVNCQDSRVMLKGLAGWLDTFEPDIVHINCGLHDIKTPYDSDARQVSLPEYEQNLRMIFEYLKAQANLTVIWATTTPVNEVWHHDTKGFDRYQADVRQYNATALALVEAVGFPVDDLYAVIPPAKRDALLKPDGVHYLPEGYDLLAEAVVRCLRDYV